MGRVVVGVDGSAASAAALAWAATHAAERDATLQVVNVYRASDEANPHDVGAAGGEASTTQADVARMADDWRTEHDRHEREQAGARIAHMLHGLDDLPEHVETIVVEGRRPAAPLVDLSEDADILVVGSRGRGGFTGLLLGSVSQQLAGHAHCPVVIVRDPAAMDG